MGDVSKGGWVTVSFLGSPISAWMPPVDLWDIYSSSPRPTPAHLLVQVADDAPHRWLLPA